MLPHYEIMKYYPHLFKAYWGWIGIAQSLSKHHRAAQTVTDVNPIPYNHYAQRIISHKYKAMGEILIPAWIMHFLNNHLVSKPREWKLTNQTSELIQNTFQKTHYLFFTLTLSVLYCLIKGLQKGQEAKRADVTDHRSLWSEYDCRTGGQQWCLWATTLMERQGKRKWKWVSAHASVRKLVWCRPKAIVSPLII